MTTAKEAWVICPKASDQVGEDGHDTYKSQFYAEHGEVLIPVMGTPYKHNPEKWRVMTLKELRSLKEAIDLADVYTPLELPDRDAKGRFVKKGAK